MMPQEQYITTHDGLQLRTQQWQPGGPPRAVVVLTHGHGEHSGRYGHVAGALCAAGYVVLAYDLRGHGRSGGPRGHVPRYDALLDDVQVVVDTARQAYPGLKVFLYGHSLGGQIVLAFVIQRRPNAAGVIASGALLVMHFYPPAWKIALARGLARIWPGFTQKTGLDLAMPMSHDDALLKAFPDLDLTHTFMSARLGMDLLAVGAEVLARASEIELPLLLLHGGADRAVDPAGTRTVYERAASRDKTLRIYPGLYHEVHNELEREEVLRDVVGWLQERA